MIVCIDSHPFIWGIKKTPTKGQEHLVQRAEDFFKWIDDSGHDIVIPTLVIAEILSPEPIDKHTGFISVINDNFIVGDFDIRVAKKCAELLKNRHPDIDEHRKVNSVRKEKMKFDYGIVATAIVYGATCIYSHDDDIIKIAKGIIEVRELPIIGRQTAITFNEGQ